MMQILIFSDSHGDRRRLREALLRHPAVSAVCHLGDGARDMAQVAQEFPDRTVFGVCGNCDMCTDLPLTRLEKFGGKKVLLTHGHAFSVKSGLLTYQLAAQERGADVALFGHTHRPFEENVGGVYLFNPGSLRDGYYGLLDISGAEIYLKHLEL